VVLVRLLTRTCTYLPDSYVVAELGGKCPGDNVMARGCMIAGLDRDAHRQRRSCSSRKSREEEGVCFTDCCKIVERCLTFRRSCQQLSGINYSRANDMI
jgi:hypothetical protein